MKAFILFGGTAIAEDIIGAVFWSLPVLKNMIIYGFIWIGHDNTFIMNGL